MIIESACTHKAAFLPLKFLLGDTSIEKEVVVGERFERVSALRPGGSWTARLLHPTEPALPSAAPVSYPMSSTMAWLTFGQFSWFIDDRTYPESRVLMTASIRRDSPDSEDLFVDHLKVGGDLNFRSSRMAKCTPPYSKAV